MGLIYLVLFLATIPAANWMIHGVGTVCLDGGPCLVPVGFGLMAPSGVLVIGVAFVLRDFVHREYGALATICAIVVGAAMSVAVGSADVAIASGVAFLVSEMVDLAVYAPLARRRFVLAVGASSIVGSIVDSALFLMLAFGSLDHMAGQIVGKLAMVGAAVIILMVVRQRRDQGQLFA